MRAVRGFPLCRALTSLWLPAGLPHRVVARGHAPALVRRGQDSNGRLPQFFVPPARALPRLGYFRCWSHDDRTLPADNRRPCRSVNRGAAVAGGTTSRWHSTIDWRPCSFCAGDGFVLPLFLRVPAACAAEPFDRHGHGPRGRRHISDPLRAGAPAGVKPCVRVERRLKPGPSARCSTDITGFSWP